MKKNNFHLNDKIWITWETQTRNHTLSAHMDATLFKKDPKLTPLLRYPYLIFWTTQLLFRNKAKVVFAQNPSLILSFLTIVLGKFFLKKHIIIDAHNIALESITGFWSFLEIIRKFIIKHATFTIISNSELTKRITMYGGTPIVLPDPIPKPDKPNSTSYNKLAGRKNVLYICSWSNDEPYYEVIKSASMLNDGVMLYISGNSKGKLKDKITYQRKNIILTGFIDKGEFEYLLHSVDVVVDLTSRESCLLCGAYEAVAAEKPMVLSNTRILREYFYKGAAFTDNTASDIAKKINSILNDSQYADDVAKLRKEISIAWLEKRNRLKNAIATL